MSGNMSGLPPSALVRLNALADIQAVAVKLINLPDSLQSNPSPVKLQGTVAGQNPDGSVQLQTDKGVITMMLKDRQPLPQGSRIEIDIPAGRPPQQAGIRPAPDQPAQAHAAQPGSAPSLASQLAQNPLSSAATAASLRLDRTSNLKPTEIEDALRAAAPKLSDLAALKAPPAPLQAGQNIRLIPIPPGQGEAIPVQPGQIQALPQQMLLAALMEMVEQLPATMQAQKTQLMTLIARMDLTSLQIPSQDGKSPPSLPQLVQNFLQQIDLPEESSARPLSIRYEPITLFNPAKPVDVQINAFLTTGIRPSIAAPVLPGQVQVQIQGQAASIPSQIAAAAPLQQTTGQPTQAGPAPSAPLPSVPAQPASPSTGTTAPVATALPPQVLPAQVTGFTAQNLPIVSLTVPAAGFSQSYVAQFPTSNLQVGSPLLISILPNDPSGTTAMVMPQAAPVSLSAWIQPGTWDNFTDLLQTLHQINPAAAHSLSQILPSPAQPQNMGGLALFFLSVLRSGDMESWMSPQVANLLRQSGRGDALRALTSDVALTGRSENLALASDWRATMLPFYHDQQIHKVPLYYRHMQEDDESGDRARRMKLMRFLFDLKLARMGNVQIDGFMQPQRLDMIMRTKSPLSVPMQRTMQGLYATAMDKSNLNGELTFQFKPEHWVSIDIPVTKEEAGLTA